MDFIDLQDTPTDYVGDDGKSCVVDEVNNQLIFAFPQPMAHGAQHENGGADEINVAGLSGELADNQKSTFLKLSDTPAAFAGEALKMLRVNAGANAVEFFTAGRPEWEYVAITNPVGVAQVQFAGLTSTKRYKVVWRLTATNAGAYLKLRMNNDGGNNYRYADFYWDSTPTHAVTANAAYSSCIISSTRGLGISYGIEGEALIAYDLKNANRHFCWSRACGWNSTNNDLEGSCVSNLHTGSALLSSIEVLVTAGTITGDVVLFEHTRLT